MKSRWECGKILGKNPLGLFQTMFFSWTGGENPSVFVNRWLAGWPAYDLGALPGGMVNWLDMVLRLCGASLYVKLMLGRSDEAEEEELLFLRLVSGNGSGSGKRRKKRCEGRTCVMVWRKWEAGRQACLLACVAGRVVEGTI